MQLEMVHRWVRDFRPLDIGKPADEREFLPAALEIVETPPSPAGRILVFGIVAAALIALLWACLGKIDIIATAPGKIVPVGNTKIVQPMDIGIVRAIHVNDGDVVQAGQVLIELDPVQARAERDRFAQQLRPALLDLAVKQSLWDALKVGAEPELGQMPADATADERVAAETALQARYGEQTAAIADLDQQIVEKTAEITSANASLAKLQAALPFVQQQADLRSELLKLQFSNKLAYLQAQQALVEQQHQLLVLRGDRAQAVAQKNGLVQKREGALAAYKKTLLDDLDKARSLVAELSAGLAKAEDSLKAKTLKAPITGTVQELAVHTVGGVVTPAQQLMFIVPSGGGVVVDAMVNNKDIGFVHVGQVARVKVDTFNFTRYGLIEGTVVGVSRDAVQQRAHGASSRGGEDKEGSQPQEATPSYVARIKLARSWMETETGRVALGPGMGVSAEIQTGRRRIIDYLLSPLEGRVDESLHER